MRPLRLRLRLPLHHKPPHHHRPYSTADPTAYLSRTTTLLTTRPPKLILDHLSPTPSHLLTLALASYLPPAALPVPLPTPPNYFPPPLGQEELPQGHHLVYFPIQTLTATGLMADGTDPDLAPPPAEADGEGFPRRMWAGGEVRFSTAGDGGFRLDGGRGVCSEGVWGVSGRVGGEVGGDKVFVDVGRRYGRVLEGETEGEAGGRVGRGEGVVVEEVRRLVFLRERRGGEEGAVGRVVRGLFWSWSVKVVGVMLTGGSAGEAGILVYARPGRDAAVSL